MNFLLVACFLAKARDIEGHLESSFTDALVSRSLRSLLRTSGPTLRQLVEWEANSPGTWLTRECLMNNDFWLALHHLASSYSIEGLTAEERMAKILTQFERMPVVSQREVLADLALVAYNMPDVYVAATACARLLAESSANSVQSKSA